MRDLRGKNALLTGGSRGIGLVIARTLAAEGINLALAARSAAALEAVARELAESGIRVVAIPVDVTDPARRQILVDRAEAELGPIDFLINNAGIAEWVQFAHQEPENIVRELEVNLIAPILLARLVLPKMLERGRGKIITLSSLGGKKGIAYEAAYAASKAGLIEWTNALNMELQGTGVSASVICPMTVSDTGEFASYGIPVSRLAGAVSAGRVAEGVLRAMTGNSQEIVVRQGPTKVLIVLNAFSPALGNIIVKRLGIVEVFRKLSEASHE